MSTTSTETSEELLPIAKLQTYPTHLPRPLREKGNKSVAGIVPQELTEENYEDWKICLKHYLVGHGLWGVVSGKEPEPSKDRKQEHDEWKKKNALALHAIQLSCGPRTFAKFKEARICARVAWNHLAEKIKRPHKFKEHDHEEENRVEDEGAREYLNYGYLYKAIEEGKWHDIKSFLEQDPNGVRVRVSSHKDTALHIAILVGHIKIAEELVKKMQPQDLELINEYGATALSLAAISGSTKLAKAIIEKNHKLVSMENDHDDGQLPVIVAGLYGQKRTVRYLYKVTPKEDLRGERGATLLNCLVTAEIFDVASMLLKRYPHLGVTPDHSGDYTLRILAHKPSAFPSGTKFVVWKRWIYSCVMVHSPWESSSGSPEDESLESHRSNVIDFHNIDIPDSNDDDDDMTADRVHEGLWITNCVSWILHRLGWSILRCIVPDIKHIHDRKLVNDEAAKLLSCIFKEIRHMSKSQLEKMEIDKILYDAIKHGIIEFVVEILKFTPEIMWRKDKKGRTIFAHAIFLRQEKIFSLIYGLGAQRSIMARRHDVFGNNYLHLAAKLSPPSQLDRVSGAALQMQRELQWFKEVERIVQPKMKEDMNDNKKTPSTLFFDEHQVLAREGERWMKNTAGSSMIVGTLISAVMFTTAFTIPGGNDNGSGLPILLETQTKPFLIFMVSNALSMFTSSTSILMFLGILTARYAEEDFLKSLPTKLIFGLTCLFFSIVTMMLSFGAAIYLMLNKQLAWVFYPIVVLSTVPVAFFSLLQFPLLVEMMNCTYGSGIFNNPKRKITW
ncbi:hypothetical protein ACH5RR_012685 [Cinchona calisaya]|uniref:PGG domain-containing protein n=1 Tax=Cinchona calisaya TaxID=153742 RepID=A0ABD3A8G9_9GENT